MDILIDTRPKESSGGGGKSREDIVKDKAQDLLSKLPPDYNMGDVKDTCNKLSGPK